MGGRISAAFWLGSGESQPADVAVCVQRAPKLAPLCDGRIRLYVEYSAWHFVIRRQCKMRSTEMKLKDGCRERTVTYNERDEVCEL